MGVPEEDQETYSCFLYHISRQNTGEFLCWLDIALRVMGLEVRFYTYVVNWVTDNYDILVGADS